MKRALIIGASGGIGAALAQALARRDAAVTTLSRGTDGFDLCDAEGVGSALSALAPGFDLIVVASGVLSATRPGPEKSLRDLSSAEMAAQFAVNAIGPALVLRHAKRLLVRDRRAVFAALSARVGSIGDNRAGGWYSYRAAKAALNQIVRTGAIELARTHRQSVCVALHPGTVATGFTAGFQGYDKLAPAESAENLLWVLDGLGPGQSGGFFDWRGAPVPW